MFFQPDFHFAPFSPAPFLSPVSHPLYSGHSLGSAKGLPTGNMTAVLNGSEGELWVLIENE